MSDSVTPWIETCQAPVSPTVSQSCSKSCPLSCWCSLTISSSAAVPSFAFNLSQHQGLFQWVGSFPMSWLFTAGGQSTGSSASGTGLAVNIQGWFPLGLTDLISLQPMGLSKRVVFSATVQKHQFFETQPSLWTNSHIHTWLLERNIALIILTFVSRAMCLLFNTLSRFVIVFLPGSKHLLISWLQSPSTVILEPKKWKSVTASTFSLFICH